MTISLEFKNQPSFKIRLTHYLLIMIDNPSALCRRVGNSPFGPTTAVRVSTDCIIITFFFLLPVLLDCMQSLCYQVLLKYVTYIIIILRQVYNKNEVYKIMAQGQERKRVASTLMNAQSRYVDTFFNSHSYLH